MLGLGLGTAKTWEAEDAQEEINRPIYNIVT